MFHQVSQTNLSPAEKHKYHVMLNNTLICS